MKATVLILFIFAIFGCSNQPPTRSTTQQYNYSVIEENGGFLITNNSGKSKKLTAYGDQIIRLQSLTNGEVLLPNDHYEMVLSHDWPKTMTVKKHSDKLVFSTRAIQVEIDASSLAATFFHIDNKTQLLREVAPTQWQQNTIKTTFEYDNKEHFTGLGHGYYARESGIDLKGKIVERNYGSAPIEQAPLLVPFYMSNKGYGVFLNSMFSNKFNFGVNDNYTMEIDDSGFSGQMDYFFIAGPKLTKVLDNYTQLTGRPRLPMKSIFGLQLSDKGHDHNSPTPSDENWWRAKIAQHKNANLPIDHVVNDNRWRAAGGKRCESKIEWDKGRYPSPAAYKKWLDENDLTITLDFNRCIGQYSDGWDASFNLPQTGEIEFPNSAPDLTNPKFRKWFWQVFYDKALNPALNYPGDALWIDEFDEQGAAPKNMVLANGRSSAEMRNYWFFLISKALVQQGWDKSDINNRPFVWVRGMTAGAQRYATLWSGDIYPNYDDMAGQIRSMQLAGMSGFPYWGHDAGGFYDWKNNVGPDDNMYQQWSMAFGSFAPIWKPHGMGASRWPLDRNKKVLSSVNTYAKLRYQLMPYIYTSAHQAAKTGLPMTRAMALLYQDIPQAWQYDLQYMWGDNLLVAPLAKDRGEKEIWLPEGIWIDYFSHKRFTGGKVISQNVNTGSLPLFVKEGAIIPKRDYALSTQALDKTRLLIDVYTGSNGEFTLIEDDDKTEAYANKKELMTTTLGYRDSVQKLVINGATGTYNQAPTTRAYQVTFIGITQATSVLVNDKEIEFLLTKDGVTVEIPSRPIEKSITVVIK